MRASSSLLRQLLTSASLALLALISTAAQTPSPTGTIQGRVFNPASREYVGNAEVRLVRLGSRDVHRERRLVQPSPACPRARRRSRSRSPATRRPPTRLPSPPARPPCARSPSPAPPPPPATGKGRQGAAPGLHRLLRARGERQGRAGPAAQHGHHQLRLVRRLRRHHRRQHGRVPEISPRRGHRLRRVRGARPAPRRHGRAVCRRHRGRHEDRQRRLQPRRRRGLARHELREHPHHRHRIHRDQPHDERRVRRRLTLRNDQHAHAPRLRPQAAAPWATTSASTSTPRSSPSAKTLGPGERERYKWRPNAPARVFRVLPQPAPRPHAHRQPRQLLHRAIHPSCRTTTATRSPPAPESISRPVVIRQIGF